MTNYANPLYPFSIVRTEHPDCSDCYKQAENAVIMARATGSVGAISKLSASGDGRGHRATVAKGV